jgi:predicted NAD/FAD-dependent oxidoreductase
LVSALLSPLASSDLWDSPDSDILERVMAEAGRLLPGLADRLLFYRVYRWEYGAVQLPPGEVRAKAELRRLLQGLPGSIAFAGDGLYKSSLETAFNTGVAAARRLVRVLLPES